MTTHVLRLNGCASRPLALYLQALGVLRLVAEQADPDAMGMWRESGFVLISKLDHEALLRFFLEDYSPTPLLDPWNGGSGFYPKDNKSGIDPIRASTANRFKAYRTAIALADRIVDGADKAPDKADKDAFIRRYVAGSDDHGVAWVDAAIVLTGDGDPKYPALFGTGGNDGRLDFTNNFMQRLVALFDAKHPEATAMPGAEDALGAALLGYAAPKVIEKNAIGQFFPSAAGGANAGNGPTGDAAVNPWHFVLMLEGGLALRASAVRRLAEGVVRACAPFAVHTSPAGFGTAVDSGDKDRGEQWLPIWQRPARYAEVIRLFGEGRSFVGGEPAKRPLDFARAVARQGVARGIDAFERFGFLERNGQSNLATALGRWHVEPRPRQDLLDPFADWSRGLAKAARDRTAPASIRRLSRQVEARMMDCTKRPDEARTWCALLVAAGEVERQCVASPRFAAAQGLRPIPPLAAELLDAIDDGTCETRLAVALASVFGRAEVRDVAPDLRSYWLPIENAYRFSSNAHGLVVGNRVVGTGGDLTEDLLRVLGRRVTELRQRNHRASLGLMARGHRYASLDDVAAYVDGVVDERRIVALALPLMAVRSFQLGERSPRSSRPGAAYAVFRLVAPFVASGSNDVVLEPRVLRALAQGDAIAASTYALARLRSLGHHPKLGRVVMDRARLRRVGASLLFPISPADESRCRAVVFKPELETLPEEGFNA